MVKQVAKEKGVIIHNMTTKTLSDKITIAYPRDTITAESVRKFIKQLKEGTKDKYIHMLIDKLAGDKFA